MFKIKKTIKISLIIIFITSFTILVNANYIETNHDTKRPPEEISYDINEPLNMEQIHETEDYVYYYREVSSVIGIYDKRNKYTWKTGIDVDYDTEIQLRCNIALSEIVDPDNLTEEERKMLEEICIPLEANMTATYEALANSLLTIEYYDRTNVIRSLSSANPNVASSKLYTVNNDSSHQRFDVSFFALDLTISMHIYLTNEGMRYEIRDEEINGEDQNLLASIIINPFFGASGGVQQHFNLETLEYDREQIPKPKIDGYVLVPDGSGALIRYNSYDTTLQTFSAKVYGNDISRAYQSSSNELDYVPLKTLSIPLYGMVHGDRQAAFMGYASKGAEYMDIIAWPEGRTSYTYAYPKFNYNSNFLQVFNQQGEGYNTVSNTRANYDIELNYNFLANDDEFSADYVGMAKRYQKYLVENDVLNEKEYAYSDIPIRLDFLMSDTEKALIGYNDVIMTTINDVENILEELHANDIKNINSGLYGYQKGGITLGSKDKPKFDRSMGNKKSFRNVINNLNGQNIDVSLAQDYAKLYEEQKSLNNVATKHINGQYVNQTLTNTTSFIENNYYTRPDIIVKQLLNNIKRTNNIGVKSYTLEGISNQLYSDYSKNVITRSNAIDLYQDTFKTVNKDYMINAKEPNQYLWKYTDRYMNAPVYNSQYLIENDTVPFLQLILNNSMELYAPYANFSFYTNEDLLRMIDYNVYPSFVLTKEPSYLLSNTTSANYYSTEYNSYKDLIEENYNYINNVLGSVINEKWIDRIVLAPGIILNKYNNNKNIIINYTNNSYTINNVIIDKVSAKYIEGIIL